VHSFWTAAIVIAYDPSEADVCSSNARVCYPFSVNDERCGAGRGRGWREVETDSVAITDVARRTHE
jgi:hypothetical protein